MPKYTVDPTCCIKHNGKIYQEGEEIELSLPEAEGLHVSPKKAAKKDETRTSSMAAGESEGK